MAIIKCHECNGNVSDTAKLCPHCGYAFKPVEVVSPMSKTELGEKQTNITVGVVMIILGVVGIIGGIFLIAIFIGIFPLFGGIALIVYGYSKINGMHTCICPYCDHKSTIGTSAQIYRCPNCKKTSTRRGNYLETTK